MAGYDLGELIELIEEILGRELDDAPRLIASTVGLALRAIRKRSHGEALNQLRKAGELLLQHPEELADWRAEIAALWAFYYFTGGPETQANAMYRKIREAQQLEPDNQRLMEVVNLIKEARGQD